MRACPALPAGFSPRTTGSPTCRRIASASREEGQPPGGVRRRRCASEGAARGRALLWRRRDCSGPAKKIPVFCVTVPGARHVTALGHSTALLLQGAEGGIPGGPLAVPACLPLAFDVLVSEVEDHRTYGNPYGTARAANHRTTTASRSEFSLLHCARSGSERAVVRSSSSAGRAAAPPRGGCACRRRCSGLKRVGPTCLSPYLGHT
jgi:hypothetical protein